MPTSEESGQKWNYTLSKPDGTWFKPDFDDKHWFQGNGVFSSQSGNKGTSWTTPDIWLRRTFSPGAITADQLTSLVLTEFHRGHMEVYINGMETYTEQGNNRALEILYGHRPLSPDVRKAVIPNTENTISVHCRAVDREGEEKAGAFDAGLAIRV